MNAIEQKKLAIIKSNAAPEVKLKALEKLDNATLGKREPIDGYRTEVMDMATKLSALCDKVKANLNSKKQEVSKINDRIFLDGHRDNFKECLVKLMEANAALK
jgi:hypothetical protein